MNKQEALEALLAKCRGWEYPTGRRRVDLGRVLEEMNEAMDRLVATDEATDQQAQLAIIGAAALYLLTDEVEVVQGRTLDEWLAIQEAYRLPGLKPINGTIGRLR